jgi:uncharacterized membrane protein
MPLILPIVSIILCGNVPNVKYGANLMPKRHIEWDLPVIDFLILLLVVVHMALPEPVLREIPGLLFILLFPGYVLVTAVFPGQKSLSTTTRLALSLGFSIAVSVFIGLILGISPWGFTLKSILITMSVFTLVTSGVAWRLRDRHRKGNRSASNTPSFFIEAIKSFRSAGWGYRSLVIILLCLIVGGLGSVCYIITRPLPAQPFTEFYILGTGGKAEAYPHELRAGEEGRVVIGIVNHEAQKTSYSVRVKADGTQLYELPGIILGTDQKWQQDIGFIIRETGNNRKVEFLLYKDGTDLYESRYLLVNVSR